ncbi:Predicted ester cyclase [Parasphingorhabdus marina DSM 22363]|uniref:Predicted ester cyclase n=1 Tax=Parasphingorhabdus marina DSM 22363 TaxID=1123272 RepID=A0A1N6D385_9SPHN|nr:ester cyclase [Parasphingorhabdus marina]SIN65292.1 Predicted ester cyclase [Parasphingorhabdus marina DSM 22363]
MTEKLPVTIVATSSEQDLLNPQPGRRMDMPGFDEEFVDFPDYIVRITDRIWHQRQVGLCLDYYAPDCTIHTLAGDITGAQTVVDNTHATLAAFPDRRLDPDNVIWSDEGGGSFYSSHLITSPMTNEGDTEFGPATGRKVEVLTIADCLCRENRIVEEWLVRDNGGLVLQLGFDLDEVAEQQARELPSLLDWHKSAHGELLAKTIPEPDFPEVPERDPHEFAEAVFGGLWSKISLQLAANIYDFRAAGDFPGNRHLSRPGQITDFRGQIHAAIPDAQVQIEHVADIAYLGEARDMAIRWSLAGTHKGDGIYGPASEAPVFIMGITHWRVINGQIHREWTVWDDLAVRRQIAEYRLQT